MTNDGHPLEIVGDSSQHSTPCMENTSVEDDFDHSVLPLSTKDESRAIQSDDEDEDSLNVRTSAKLNPGIFDDEHESEADDCDLLPLPGTHGCNVTEANEDHKLNKILEKGAAKKGSRSSSRKKNRKDELMEIHSETQRIIRESRVHLPYHNPEKKSLSSVLEGIKQKREMFGLCSKKSLFDFPRSSVLSRNVKPSEKVSSPAIVSLPTVPANVPVASDPPEEERPAICKRLNFENQEDENSQEYEDLMTRLKKKKMQLNLEKADDNPVKAAIVDSSREIRGDSTELSDSSNPAEKSAMPPSVDVEPPIEGHSEGGNKTSKISELVKRYVDPNVVPKLGRKPEGEDELIIEEEPTGVEKLFLRLEKELENNKKKRKQTTSVELSASSKLVVDGVESYQVKKVLYKMDDKTEVKKTTRDQLKETLRSQIMEERHGRLQERYQAYEKLGRDRGTLRLEEDYPALPDDDEDDFGGDTSGSESESSGEAEPEEDEEEAAVERHEQANPFIDDEADVDDDDDDDDDDGGAVEGGDDDDNEVEVSDDDEIKPIKKQAAKIIDDDDEDGNGEGDADSTSKESRQQEEDGNRRQSVNLFDEDAMSCQRPETESKVSKRPFEDVGASLHDNHSGDISLSSLVREPRDVAILCSSDSSTNHHPSSSTNRISAAHVDDDDNDVSSSLVTKRSKERNMREVPSQLSNNKNNKMDSQEVISSTPFLEMDSDWLLANSMATDGRSVSQVVQGLCSTPREKNEELLMFCSGSFATQKDKTEVADNIPSSTDDMKSRKRKRDNEGEENPDSDCDAGLSDGDGDDDDETDLVNQYQPMRKKGRINDEFVEKEAELSGSEEEDDDDEEAGGVDDEMEEEEGDADDVGTEEELRNQVHRVHLKKVLDQDQREIRLLQEQLLEDGDLHDDYGLGRMRRFRWNNLDLVGDDNDGAADNASDDEGIKEGEDEAKWRIMRLEREKFLQKIQEKNKDEDSQDSTQTSLFSGNMKLKLVSSFTHDSSTPNQNKSILKSKSVTPFMKIPNLVSKSTGPKPIGSFLARSKESLARFSDPSKAGVPTFNNSTATLVSRNSRNFVFAHLSPSKKESMAKNESSKTSRVGTQPRKKPQVAGHEAPLPQSRILKLLNE